MPTKPKMPVASIRPFKGLRPAGGVKAVEKPGFQFDVVGMGLNAVDHICVVPRFPRFEEKLKMLDFRKSPGGQVASALTACARWGLRARYIGKVGGDDQGAFSLASLAEAGIDTSCVSMVKGAANQFAFILVDASTGERTIIWRRDPALEVKPEEVPAEAIRSGRFLLLDGHDSEAAALAAKLAATAGVTVVVDAETIKPGTPDLIRHAHYAVCSSDFPGRFTGESRPEEALKKIRASGPDCVVMTLGKEGALALQGRDYIRSRGFKVACVDSTGAGDVFHGAFIYGLAEGWVLERVLDFSNAAAALNCTALGARGGIRPVEEISDLMKRGRRW